MGKVGILALILALTGVSEPANAGDTGASLATVKTGAGVIRGAAAADPSIAVFKGIPYAAPPVDNLRFRPPVPAKPWNGIRAADKYGAVCPQHAPLPAGATMSEDCLTANVWTGAKSGKERRPVYVWIYGGGFNEGTSANPQFDGEMLARKGIVVITFNYRLGPLGFLATPELSKESGHNASGNYGLMDAIALLKWVKRNVAAFGGDPDRVTIGGQSAGAGTVGMLSMSPLARGLFKQSLAESQVRDPGDPELRYLNTSWRSLSDAEAAGAQYAADRGALSLSELRAMPWEKLLEGSDVPDLAVDTKSNSKPPLFRPAVDGWVVQKRYASIYADGSQNHVTYMAGNNLDESGAVPETAFATLRSRAPTMRSGSPTTNVTLAGYRGWAERKFGPMAAQFFKLYPATNDDEATRMSNAAIRDNSRSSTFLWADKWRRTVKKPIFTYFWTHARPGPSKPMRGAFHGSEIDYVFNSLHLTDLPWTDQDHQIAETMSSYWANYIKTGNPNGPGLAEWPEWDLTKPQVMELGDAFRPIPVASPEKLDFWRRYFNSQDQW